MDDEDKHDEKAARESKRKGGNTNDASWELMRIKMVAFQAKHDNHEGSGLECELPNGVSVSAVCCVSCRLLTLVLSSFCMSPTKLL